MVHEHDGILQNAPIWVKPRSPVYLLGRDVNAHHVATPVRLHMEMEENPAVLAEKTLVY